MLFSEADVLRADFSFFFLVVLFSHGQQLRTSESLLFSKQHSIKLSIHYCGTSFIFILPNNNNKKNETYFPIFFIVAVRSRPGAAAAAVC